MSSRLTLAQAATASGLSYGQVYRRVVTRRSVPSQRHGAAYTIAAADVALLHPRGRGIDQRPGVSLRARSVEEWEAWRRFAGERTVSAWLRELATAASGYGR